MYIAADTESRKKCVMIVSCPWRVQALHNSGCYWLCENYSYTQGSVMFTRSYHSFKLCRRRFPINIAFAMAISKAQGRSFYMLECV